VSNYISSGVPSISVHRRYAVSLKMRVESMQRLLFRERRNNDWRVDTVKPEMNAYRRGCGGRDDARWIQGVIGE
jgi:hypothetical protein